MSEPIWTDERIKQQAIAYSGYISSVVKALTEMRDEYEAHRLALETAYAELFAQHAQMALDLVAAKRELAAKSEIQY